jgi:hypothetical protein
MKNIHVLPTDKASRLCLRDFDNKLCLHRPEVTYHGTNQNIYITSDEEIKEGDWVYENNLNQETKVYQIIKRDDKLMFFRFRSVPIWLDKNQHGCKKIILTDDKDLIKDGVQAIDDEFLEWFVKNPSCEYVEVKELLSNNGNAFYGYKIIIPKEKPKHPKVLSENGNELFFDEQFNLIKEEPKQECKDCNKSLNDCTCIEDTIDMKQGTMSEAIKQVITDKLKQETLEEFAINWWKNKQITQQQGLCKIYLPNSIYLSLNKNEILFIFNKEHKQKEEHKQETLEEAAERILWDNTGMLIENHPTITQSMIDLAKWQQKQDNKEIKQLKDRLDIIRESTTKTIKIVENLELQQERSYSEEEVLNILYKHTEDLLAGKKVTLEEWFEQFKKK